SNLRQIGIATFAAAMDNEGVYPKREYTGSNAPQIAYSVGGSDNRHLLVGYLAGYTIEKGSPALYCPSYDGGIHSLENAWPHSRSGGTWYLWGYSYFASFPQTSLWASKHPIPTRMEDATR